MATKIDVRPFVIDDHSTVLIQTSDIDAPPSGAGDQYAGTQDQLDKHLRHAIDRIRPAADAVFESLRELNSPTQIELEFGIGISGGFDAFIASTEANANFKIKLTWDNKP